jgi:hypothetical protein
MIGEESGRNCLSRPWPFEVWFKPIILITGRCKPDSIGFASQDISLPFRMGPEPSQRELREWTDDFVTSFTGYL